jgi:hypothetical protein
VVRWWTASDATFNAEHVRCALSSISCSAMISMISNGRLGAVSGADTYRMSETVAFYILHSPQREVLLYSLDSFSIMGSSRDMSERELMSDAV